MERKAIHAVRPEHLHGRSSSGFSQSLLHRYESPLPRAPAPCPPLTSSAPPDSSALLPSKRQPTARSRTRFDCTAPPALEAALSVRLVFVIWWGMQGGSV